MIFGVRAVIEAVEAGKQIDKILIRRGIQSELSRELFAAIKGLNIFVQYVPAERLNRITRKNHQGVIAFVAAVDYQPLEMLVPSLYEAGKVPFLVLLDGLTDVRCAGVDAVVIPARGSVSVTADAVKTSAGALLSLPVCKVPNVGSALQYLKQCGFRIAAATEKGEVDYTATACDGPFCLVMGAEDTGIPAEHLALCDEWIRIPMKGKIASLNVSVAAGILIYEVVRRRQ